MSATGVAWTPWRALDRALAAFFALFTLGWLAFDLPVALGLVDETTGWYAREVDPLFLHPPLWLDVVGALAAAYGPVYAALAYGLARGRRWVCTVALPFSGLITGTNAVYVGVELLGDVRPRNVLVWTALNVPYVVVPLVLLARCLLAASRGRERVSP